MCDVVGEATRQGRVGAGLGPPPQGTTFHLEIGGGRVAAKANRARARDLHEAGVMQADEQGRGQEVSRKLAGGRAGLLHD